MRDKQVRRTMNNIRKVLRDRQAAYEHANLLMEQRTVSELLEPSESIAEPEAQAGEQYSSVVTREASTAASDSQQVDSAPSRQGRRRR